MSSWPGPAGGDRGLGYLVTMPTDACATYSAERRAAAVATLSGYCRQIRTDAPIAELEG